MSISHAPKTITDGDRVVATGRPDDAWFSDFTQKNRRKLVGSITFVYLTMFSKAISCALRNFSLSTSLMPVCITSHREI